MPDMKTELTKVIQSWEEVVAPDPTPQVTKGKKLFPVTTNVSRDTFNYIQQHPNLKPSDVVRALSLQGHKPSSVTSMVYQMISVGRVVRDAKGGMHTAVKEYQTIKESELRAARAAKKPVQVVKAKPVKPAPKAVEGGIAALQPQAVQPTQDKSERVVMDIDEWLNEVPLMQARMAYMKLKAIFEGGAA